MIYFHANLFELFIMQLLFQKKKNEQVRYLRQKLKFAAFERDLGLFLLRHRNILPGLKVNPEVTQVETKSKKGQ